MDIIFKWTILCQMDSTEICEVIYELYNRRFLGDSEPPGTSPRLRFARFLDDGLSEYDPA